MDVIVNTVALLILENTRVEILEIALNVLIINTVKQDNTLLVPALNLVLIQTPVHKIQNV
jgi:hypothetical protein